MLKLPPLLRRPRPAPAAAAPAADRPPPGVIPPFPPGLLGALSPQALTEDAPPGGDGAYRRMQTDPQVKACLTTKKFAVLSGGWTIHAASESPGDQDAARFARAVLARMRGSMTDALYDILDALALGVSLVEIVWEPVADGPYAGCFGIAALKAHDPADWTLETDRAGRVTALRARGGAAGPAAGPTAYSPARFLRYAPMPRYGSPVGQSDLRAAYGSWFVKTQLLRWWAKYLEKFGLPTVTGAYDPGRGYGPEQQRELLALVSQVHNESAVVLPSDMTLGLLETSRAQTANFAEAIEYLDRAIAKSILGQTLTVDGTGSGATYALGQVHRDVLHFYLRKLQRDLEETVVDAQLLAPLTRYNFGPDVSPPTFHLAALDDGRLETAGRLIAALVAGAVIAPDEPWLRAFLGLPEREDKER